MKVNYQFEKRQKELEKKKKKAEKALKKEAAHTHPESTEPTIETKPQE